SNERFRVQGLLGDMELYARELRRLDDALITSGPMSRKLSSNADAQELRREVGEIAATISKVIASLRCEARQVDSFEEKTPYTTAYIEAFSAAAEEIERAANRCDELGYDASWYIRREREAQKETLVLPESTIGYVSKALQTAADSLEHRGK